MGLDEAKGHGRMAKQLGNFVQDLRLPKGFMRDIRCLRMLDLHGSDGICAVLYLWDYVAEHFPTDGRLAGISARDIHLACHVSKESESFVNDLMECSFLALGDDGVYFLPNWREEQPYVSQAEERSQAARLKAEKRWGTKRSEEAKPMQCSGNATALQQQCSNTNSNAFKSPPAPPSGGEGEVPVNEIAELYSETLPELPKPVLTPRVLRDIKARWAAEPERQELEWWREFFGRVRTMPRLMGEGDDKLCASLGWLVNRGCMDKILAGQYLTRAGGVRQPLRSMSDEEFEAMRAREAAELEPG